MRINAEAEEDPSVDEEAREWFRKLEVGDEEAIPLWQWFRDESLVEFNVFMMNSVFLLIATTVKPSTMIRWMKS